RCGEGVQGGPRIEQVPDDLLVALPPDAAEVVTRWWASLSDADRSQVAGLWDERLEVRSFAPQPDAGGLAHEPARRTFHIGCTLPVAARKCLATGEAPVGFVCPVGSEACPLPRLRGARLTRGTGLPGQAGASRAPHIDSFRGP